MSSYQKSASQRPPRPADRPGASNAHQKYHTNRTPPGNNGTTGRRTGTSTSKRSSEARVTQHRRRSPTNDGARYDRQTSNTSSEYDADPKQDYPGFSSSENYSQNLDSMKPSSKEASIRTSDAKGSPQLISTNPPTDINSERSQSLNDPYLLASPVQQNSLTKAFMERTGAEDLQLINDILAGTNWNLDAALQAYECIQNDQSEVQQPDQTISPQSTEQTPSSQTHSAPSESNSNLEKERRLVRGLSKVYELRDGAASMERDKQNILKAASDPNFNSSQLNINISLDNTYILPDLSTLSPGLADYVEQELIDFVTMNVLERTGHINWWAKHSLSRRLWPLHTTGDGNCLLHAASLGMWGVQDRHLHLRVKLHRFLSKQNKSGPLYRRWRWQQTQSNMEMSLVFSDEEWQSEWEGLINLSSATAKIIEDDGQEYAYLDFLEEFHVYVLAQIIGRPIIVFADSVIRDVNGFPLSPVPFGGIYLPMECRAGECFKSPLLLAYDRSHFTAVVAMSSSKGDQMDLSKALIPLTGPECDLLPMHFFVDPGADVDWDNLPEDRCTMMDVITSVEDYFEVRKIPLDQVKAGVVLTEDSLSDAGSSPSLNKEGKAKSTSIKSTILKKTNPKSSRKVKESKNAPSDLELEPGNELIMCARLTIKTPKAYAKDMEKYLEITRVEYEDKKARNALKDPKTIPLIATKDYAKKLALQTDSSSHSAVSPAAMSPNNSLCKKCEQYLGTAEQDNLCSACYRQQDGERLQSDRCRQCHKFQGTKENHYYCSQCHQQILEGKLASDQEQVNNSNVSGVRDNDLSRTYRIPLSEEDSAQYRTELLRSRPANSRDKFGNAESSSGMMTDLGIGNPSLRPSYDKTPPAGHLQRAPASKQREHAGNPMLTLGMDPQVSLDRLHMVSETTKSYSIPRSTIYQDEQRGIGIPINHCDSPPRSSMPRGSGGIRCCKKCESIKMPVDMSGLCRYCRAHTQPARQRVPSQQYAQKSPPVILYKHAKSLMLSQCKRVGCYGTACSNNGLCRSCMDS